MTVTVPAGVNGGELERALQEAGLDDALLPAVAVPLHRSTSWLATLATGQFSSRYGGVEDLVVGYRVVLADGAVAELTAAPRAAMGPDLRRIFLGSEGTLGVITRVTLKIMPIPAARELAAFSVPDVVSGLAILRAQAARGLRPALLRLYDVDEARHVMADADVSSPVLFTGTEGEPAIAAAEMAVLTAIAEEHGAVAIGPEPVEAWLDQRFDFSR